MTKKAPKILRVGIIQGGRIVEERLLRRREQVTVGFSPKNTFVVPISNLPRSFALLDVRGGRYVLNFQKDTKGRVSLEGGVFELAELARSGKARKKAGGFQLELNQQSRGKVVLGEVTLLFQFVAPPPLPPKLKLPASARGGWIKSIEWHFVGFLMVSALLQVVPMTWLVLQDWPAPKRGTEIPNKFVTLIMKRPEKPPEPPKVDEKKDGEGPGDKEKDKPKEARKAVAAGDKKDDPEAAARAAAVKKRALAKAVRGKTLLKFITSRAGDDEQGASGLVDALAHGAARSRVDEAFAGATGVATASPGMDRSRRGGAASDQGGTVATIDGLGASAARRTVGGTGKKRAERRVTANIAVSGPSNTFGTGKMDRSDIARVVKLRIRAVKSCYERELKKDPTLRGKVVVQFTIGEVGRVTNSKIASSTMSNAAVGSCILGRIRSWRFPKPEGGSVTVSYPFVFTASQ